MSERHLRRPRPLPGASRFARALALRALPALLVCALAPAGAAGQETDTILPQADTVPLLADTFQVVDSILEPEDTLTFEPEIGDTLAADSAGPPPRLVPLELARPVEPGFAEGVWVWNRAALLRATGLDLGDLLDRIPSLTRVRGGYYTQPSLVVSPFALSGDVEILLDGYPLDPLTATTYDVSRIRLADLERVRVERRGGRLRIELTQLEHPSPRGGYETSPDSGTTYTRVEIATGDLDNDGLAGVFMAPRFLFGPFAAAVSRLDSDGIGRSQPGQVGRAWVRWSFLRERWGLHAEYHSLRIDRNPDSPVPGEQTQVEMIVRARARPWDAFTAELYAGRTTVDDEFVDSVATELSGTHVGARATFERDRIATHAAVRLRNGDVGPGLSGELGASLRPIRFLSLSGEYGHEDWHDANAGRWVASAAVGPFLGARAFAEVAGGEHGIHWIREDGATPVVERSLQRAGIDWSLGGFRAGVAAFRGEGDRVAPPAIPGIGLSDSTNLPLYPGYDLQGFEASVRIPLFYEPVGLEGFYTRLSAAGDGALSIFQPVEQVRAAIVWHDLPLSNTQFEVEARLEGEYRGVMLSPGLDGTAVQVDASQRLNFDLSIRVLDIHAYVSWQNILHDVELHDLPDRFLPGQTAYFGVKWELWN